MSHFAALAAATAFAMAAWSAAHASPTEPPSTETSYPAASDPSSGGAERVNRAEPTGAISLHDALALSLARNPRIAAFAREIEAAEGRLVQAGLRPNPELGLLVEKIGGKGAMRGADAAETTADVRQLIELGGKRGKRRQVAGLGRDLARWDYRSARLDVVAETSRAFVGVVSAQESLALAREIAGLAGRARDAAADRVRAGKVSPLEQTRAEVALASARLDVERRERALVAARRSLAAAWGSAEPAFARAEGDLRPLAPPPPFDELEIALSRNPDLARWDAEIAQQRAALSLARARNIPDPTVSAGVRRFEETKSEAFVAGLSIPVPIFGINPGGVREARANLARAFSERQAVELRLHAGLAVAYENFASSYRSAQTLRTDILPAAERAYAAAREGFTAGKFGFLDVLDAQRTLFAARRGLLDALASYQQARIDTARLAGRSVEPGVELGGDEGTPP